MRPDPPPRSNRRDIFNLDVFEVKRFLAVFAVERPLRALALVVALLLVEADVFFAGGAGDDHELALALVVELERSRASVVRRPRRGPRARRELTSYSLMVPFQVQFSLMHTAGRCSTSLRTALSGKA